MSIELERKYSIKNKDSLIRWLDNNAEFVASVTQDDTIFKGSILDANNILRHRRENNKSILTFKNLVFEGQTFKYCNESEAVVLPENVDKISKILCYAVKDIDEQISKQMNSDNIEVFLMEHGVTPEYRISKCRDNYKCGDILISVDKVNNLGEFVEMECLGSVDANSEIKDIIKDIIIQIEPYIGEQVNKGYVDLIKEKKIPNSTLKPKF